MVCSTYGAPAQKDGACAGTTRSADISFEGASIASQTQPWRIARTDCEVTSINLRFRRETERSMLLANPKRASAPAAGCRSWSPCQPGEPTRAALIQSTRWPPLATTKVSRRHRAA